MNNRSGGWFDSILKGEGPIGARTLAILLMSAGALGFIITLVALDKQTVCLLVSTVVVFGGLGINIMARKYNDQQAQAIPEQQSRFPVKNQPPVAKRLKERMSAQERSIPVQAPAPANWIKDNQPAQPIEAHPSTKSTLPVDSESRLAAECTVVLEQQGARVRLDVQHEDRSVLRIVSPTGKDWVAMVHEGSDEIGVGDLRALFALMNNQSAIGAFLVSSGSFSPQAEEWAQKRSITLIPANRIGDIVLD
jgi:hypothetical protein